MTFYSPKIVLITFSLIFCEAVAVAQNNKDNHVVSFKYDNPLGELFLTLTVIRDGENVRILHGDEVTGRAYERTDPPLKSVDGNFVYLSQLESGVVETSSNSTMRHEVAYCELLDTRSGCIVARETGEFCGGFFTFDGKWENPLYPSFNLASEKPRAIDFVSGKLKPANTPESSFENLLVCDPLSLNNADDYSIVIKKDIFNLDDARRKAFELDLESQSRKRDSH